MRFKSQQNDYSTIMSGRNEFQHQGTTKLPDLPQFNKFLDGQGRHKKPRRNVSYFNTSSMQKQNEYMAQLPKAVRLPRKVGSENFG